MNTLLQFSDVHLQYQNGQNLTEVIKGISFAINQNERLAIVGKSGSGKTSLLMLIVRDLHPTGKACGCADALIRTSVPRKAAHASLFH